MIFCKKIPLVVQAGLQRYTLFLNLQIFFLKFLNKFLKIF